MAHLLVFPPPARIPAFATHSLPVAGEICQEHELSEIIADALQPAEDKDENNASFEGGPEKEKKARAAAGPSQ
jgi:hypothetical protein